MRFNQTNLALEAINTWPDVRLLAKSRNKILEIQRKKVRKKERKKERKKVIKK